MSTPVVNPKDEALLSRSRTENTILLLDKQIEFYTQRALESNVEGQYNKDWDTVKSIQSFKETLLRTDKRVNESAIANAEFGIPAIMVVAFIAFFVGLVMGAIVL